MNNASLDNNDIIKDIYKFYKNGKEGLDLAQEALKETIRLEGNGDLSTGAGEMDWLGRNGGVRTLGVGISTEFIRKGYIDLRGKEVRSPKQLAVLAQVFRDPRFETLRFIYIKNKKIVGYEGITSKLPAAAVAFPHLPKIEDYTNMDDFIKQMKTAHIKFFMDMLQRMNRLKADGYYLLHGHPSGVDVTPSKDDILLTTTFKSALSGFKGHVIIDSNMYGFIDKDMDITKHELYLGEDLLLKPSKPHSLLGIEIDTSKTLARLAKSVQMANNHSVIIYVNAKIIIRAIQEVPDGLFTREKECVDYLRGRMREFGSSQVILITQNQHVKHLAQGMVKKGYLLDALITEGNNRVASVRENEFMPCYISPNKWMGIRINKGYRVGESKKSNSYSGIYAQKRAPANTKKHKCRDRLPEI